MKPKRQSYQKCHFNDLLVTSKFSETFLVLLCSDCVGFFVGGLFPDSHGFSYPLFFWSAVFGLPCDDDGLIWEEPRFELLHTALAFPPPGNATKYKQNFRWNFIFKSVSVD